MPDEAEKVAEEAEKYIRMIEEGLKELRRIERDRERAARRGAFFRKLGVRTPRALIKARQAIIVRMFDGRGMRRRDRLALYALHWMIDRCEMLAYHGTLGDVFSVHID